MSDGNPDRALGCVDGDEVVDLTRRLIRLDSTNPPGQELTVAEAVAAQAHAWGLAADLAQVSTDRANVLIRLPGPPPAGPKLLYCGHLDTVPVGQAPWARPPLGGDLVDGYVWGRGAVDMKGGVAAMLAAMAALARAQVRLPGELLLAAVVGEEVNCAGSKHLLAAGGMDGVGWLVVAEPTNLDLVTAHKGALRIEAVTHGRAAHSSKPELGVNAIMAMTAVLERIAATPIATAPHPFLSPPTLSVNTVVGGSAINVVPDLCRAVIDVRTLPGQDHAELLAALEQAVGQLGGDQAGGKVELRILGEAAPVETAADDPLVARARRAARVVLGAEPAVRGVTFFSDASVLQPPTRVPTILFGPGDDALAHQVNERVAADALVAAARFFTALPFHTWDGDPADEPGTPGRARPARPSA